MGYVVVRDYQEDGGHDILAVSLDRESAAAFAARFNAENGGDWPPAEVIERPRA